MLKPTNDHIQIEPVLNDSFVQTASERYQEVGVVIQASESEKASPYTPGMRVYFDSWLAKKYPIPGEANKFYWFLHADDVVAYETVPEAVSTERL